MAFKIAFEYTPEWAVGYKRPQRQVRGVHPNLIFENEDAAQAAIDGLADASDEEWERWHQPMMDHAHLVYGPDDGEDWSSVVAADRESWWPIAADDPAVGLAEVAASLRAVAAQYVEQADELESRL